MDFPALVGSALIVVDSGTKKAGCRPGRNVHHAIHIPDFWHFLVSHEND